MNPKTLIVTGMHRSGTSLMSHYLSECGLFMGNKLLDVRLNQSQASYRGHHEDRDFLDFHKSVLKRKWMDAFPIYNFRLPVRVNNRERQIAGSLVESRAELSQWGWKDPRTTLFLDFWHSIISDPYYLFLLRNPLSVVDSVLRRGNEKHINRNPLNGLRVWRIYNRLLLKFWEEHQDISIICDIDAFIHNPDQTRCILVERFGFDLDTIPLDRVFSQTAFKAEQSERIEELMMKYPSEVSSCLELYQTLKELRPVGVET